MLLNKLPSYISLSASFTPNYSSHSRLFLVTLPVEPAFAYTSFLVYYRFALSEIDEKGYPYCCANSK